MSFLSSWLKTPKIFEVVLGLILILGIVFPVSLPFSINEFIDSALGMIVLFVATLLLFLYTNPILGVIFVVFAYFLLSRANRAVMQQKTVPILEYVPPGENAAPTSPPIETALNTPAPTTQPPYQPQPLLQPSSLEEEIILSKPTSHTGAITFEETDFKPVSNPIQGSIYV